MIGASNSSFCSDKSDHRWHVLDTLFCSSTPVFSTRSQFKANIRSKSKFQPTARAFKKTRQRSSLCFSKVRVRLLKVVYGWQSCFLGSKRLITINALSAEDYRGMSQALEECQFTSIRLVESSAATNSDIADGGTSTMSSNEAPRSVNRERSRFCNPLFSPSDQPIAYKTDGNDASAAACGAQRVATQKELVCWTLLSLSIQE